MFDWIPRPFITKIDKSNFIVPAISYHEISLRAVSSPWVTSLSSFKEQMYYLKSMKVHTLSVSQFYRYFTHSLPIPPLSLIITFDDGWKGQYDYAFPLLGELRFNATFYIPSGCIEKNFRVAEYGEGIMNWEHILELSRQGFDIQAHSSSHRNLTSLSREELEKETSGAGQVIEQKTHKKVVHFACPYDADDENLELTLVRHGYETIASPPFPTYRPPSDLLRITRYHIRSGRGMNTLKNLISYARQRRFGNIRHAAG